MADNFNQDSLDSLWGGYIEEFTFDVVRQVMLMNVTVTDSGITSKYAVCISGILNMSVKYLSADDDLASVELTSIQAKPMGEGFLDVSCEFWASDRRLDIVCLRVSVTALGA